VNAVAELIELLKTVAAETSGPMLIEPVSV